MDSEPPPRPSNRQAIRVFVSSTFVDMQQEREELIKYVFPRLRRLCEARGVSWTSVDLRWGITDEEKAEGQVLGQCFAEIERCRPYFIGILGGRYGWVPDDLSELPALCSVCATDAAGRSVTELEILHGALNHSTPDARSYFYFRQPARAVADPGASADFDDMPGEDPRLGALKQRIRDSGLPLREGFGDAQQLGEWLLADLSAAIEQDFPMVRDGENLDRDAFAHDAFAAGQAGFYVERPGLFGRLDAHIHSDAPPLVISGESGAGKTALLSAWSTRLKQRAEGISLVQHFVGATPDSGDWTHLVGRLIGAIDRVSGVDSEIPDSKEKLGLMFAEKLATMGPAHQLVALIDGIDQLGDHDGARQLAWLPEIIPGNVHIVLTASQGPTLEEIQRRQWQQQPLAPLAPDEVSDIARRFLRAYGKSLSPGLLESIRSSAPARNPLYLRILLEELRVSGRHETLHELLQRYLEYPSIETLLTAVLSRYEADYQRDRPGLVGDAMALLWASRNGLSEEELLDLLGRDGERLPSAYWVPIALACGFALNESAGLLTLFHQHFRKAVETRYLPGRAEMQARHHRLAHYFQRLDISRRQLDELPWQLAAAEQWDALVDFISERRAFDALWRQDPFATQQYWIMIGKNTAHAPAGAYLPLLDDPALSAATAHACSHLLQNTGNSAAALPFADFIIGRYRVPSESDKLAMALSHKGMLLIDIGRLDEAQQVLSEAQTLGEALLAADKTHTQVLASVLTARAQALVTTSKFIEALGVHQRIGDLALAADDQGLLAESLYQQAFLHRLLGNADQARPLLAGAETIHRDRADLDGLASVLGERAKLQLLAGDNDAALRLLHEIGGLYRQLNQPFWLGACYDEQARIHGERGDFERAAALFRQEQAIYQRHGNLGLLRWSLGNEAEVLVRKGDIPAALQRLERAEALCRQMQTPDQLAQTLDRQAQHRTEIDDFDRAMAQLQEAESLYRSAVKDDMHLGANLLSQATIHEKREQYDTSLQLLRDAEPVCRRSGSEQLLFMSLWGQSNLLAMSPPQGVAPDELIRQMEAVTREAGELAQKLDYQDIAASLRDQADRLRALPGH